MRDRHFLTDRKTLLRLQGCAIADINIPAAAKDKIDVGKPAN